MTVDPRPTNRLRAKKPSFTVSTMTDPCDDDDELSAGAAFEGTASADADAQACYSSTFERRADEMRTEEADFDGGSDDDDEGRRRDVSDDGVAECRCHLKGRTGGHSLNPCSAVGAGSKKEENRMRNVLGCRHCLTEKAENYSSGCRIEDDSRSKSDDQTDGIEGRSGIGSHRLHQASSYESKCPIVISVEGDVSKQNVTKTKTTAKGNRSETQFDAGDVSGFDDVTDDDDAAFPAPPDERFLRVGKSADWQNSDEAIYKNAADDTRVKWQGAPKESAHDQKVSVDGKSGRSAGGGGRGVGGGGHQTQDSGSGRGGTCSGKAESHGRPKNGGSEADDRRKETSGCHSISDSRKVATENVYHLDYANAANSDDFKLKQSSGGTSFNMQNQDQRIKGNGSGSTNVLTAPTSNEQKMREESRKVTFKPETGKSTCLSI